MTPAARIAAAALLLDRILAGEPAERALTNWARASRFAGSGDRSAIRDHVYDALRCRRSFSALGGGATGRGLMLGMLRDRGADVAGLFTGEGHALAPPLPEEAGQLPQGNAALDIPDWLEPPLRRALGAEFVATLQAMRSRAPVFLRVNAARGTRGQASELLAAEGIVSRPHPDASLALEVTENARKITGSQAYVQGLVDLQDVSSQAVVEALPLTDGMRVLDYCAGGGGKTLAMAARAAMTVHAHDSDPRRMADLLPRAERAGARVAITQNPAKTAPYDLILTDVPCSGSGSWRRDPAGKWALTAERLAALTAIQARILDQAAALLPPGGWLAYATCSLLAEENEDQTTAFLARNGGFESIRRDRFSPLQGGDGFYLHLMRKNPREI